MNGHDKTIAEFFAGIGLLVPAAQRRTAPLLAHCLAGLQRSANRPSALRQN
jgi:hypothetical protein